MAKAQKKKAPKKQYGKIWNWPLKKVAVKDVRAAFKEADSITRDYEEAAGIEYDMLLHVLHTIASTPLGPDQEFNLVNVRRLAREALKFNPSGKPRY